MQYLDELLALYVGRDPSTQKFLLTSLAAVPTGFDTDQVLDLLWNECGAAEARVAHQARRELGHLLPAYLKLDYGLAEQETGVWTQAHHRGDPEKFKLHLKLALLTDEELAPRVVAGLQLFAPFSARIFKLLDARQPRLKQVASMLCARLGLRSTTDQLARRATSGTPAFSDACALAELGNDEARKALLKLAGDHGKEHPDLVMLLSAAPGDETLAVLSKLEAEGDGYVRANVAQALNTAPGAERRELMVRLIKRREGWVTAYTLDALVASPKPEDFALVQLAYAAEAHEFVRVLVVKTAGYIATPQSQQFLIDRIADGTPRIQAAALEGLTRQRVETTLLAQQAIKLVQSPLLRARVNALMVLAGLDPTRVAPFIRQLLVGEQPMLRLEGAFILGYIPSEEGAGVLAEMAANDPAHPVQAQAIKSLRKQPPSLAAPRLLALTRAADPKVAVLATRALAALDTNEPGALEEALKKHLTAAPAPPPVVKAAMLKAVGGWCARRGVNGPPEVLADALKDADATVALGAIDGLKLVGDHGAPRAMKPLMEHADPRVRARAVLATVMSGEVDALRAMDELLASVMQEHVLAGFTGLLELAVVLPAALRSERFVRLSAALSSLTRAPGYAAFLEKERVPGSLVQQAQLARVNPELPAVPGAADAKTSASAIPRDAANLVKEQYSSPHNRIFAPGRRRLDSQKIAAQALLPQESTTSPATLKVKHLVGLAMIPPILIGSLVLWEKASPPPEPEAEPAPVSAPASGGGASVAPRKPIPMHGMRVFSAENAPVRKGDKGDEPLRPGDVVEPGDMVQTSASSRVVLQDEKGNSIALGTASQLRVANSGGNTGIARFEAGEGDVYVNYPQVKSLEIKYGMLKVAAGAGAFRVYKDALGLHLVSISGEVKVDPAGKLVRAGDTLDLR